MKYIMAAAMWLVVGVFAGAFYTTYTTSRNDVEFMRDCFASGAKKVEAFFIDTHEQGMSCSWTAKETHDGN